MKPTMRVLLAVMLGIVAAVLVGGFALSTTAGARSAIANAGKTVEVPVPKSTLGRSTVLNPGMFEMKPWPANFLPVDAVKTLKELEGKQANESLVAGQPISSGRLGTGGGGARVAIPDGLEALSVGVDDVAAVGGAVYPGDRVRLVKTGSQGASALVAEDVLVLATSSSATASDAQSDAGLQSSGLTWVTLALPAEMVLPVVEASDSGRMHLVLLPRK